MNRIIKFVSLVLFALALCGSAAARETVPIVDYNDVAVSTGSGKTPTADQVRDAIIAAAKSRQWSINKVQNENRLTATLIVRGKHTMVVSIPYAADKYSIKYLESVNMNYALSDAPMEGSTDLTKINTPAKTLPAGTPMIHPNYNKWVQMLAQSVRAELSRL